MDEALRMLAEAGFTEVRVEVYEFHDGEDGGTYRWNATVGRLVAEATGPPTAVCLPDMGMDGPTVLSLYRGLDQDYARALPLDSLLRPLLFVTHRDKHVLIDGWHRLWKAADMGIEVLPAYVLTQGEADGVRVEGPGQ